MSTSAPSLLLIGCGQMGTAMLKGWLAADRDLRVAVVDRHPTSFLLDHPRVTVDETVEMPGPAPQTVVLAVRPQQMDETCKALKPALAEDALVISVAAGQTAGRIQSLLHKDQPVVRTMPNTPAAIGQGITGAFATPGVSAVQKETADRLLTALGEIVWLEREDLMDPLTAVSGCGPAYVFALMEVLAKTGEKLGLPPETANRLARATVIGSGAFAGTQGAMPLSTLRESVSGPVTSAALKVLLESGSLQRLFDDALTAATTRAKELSR